MFSKSNIVGLELCKQSLLIANSRAQCYVFTNVQFIISPKGDSIPERKGIRGGSIREIMGILENTTDKPILMEPSRLGYSDKIDLWSADSTYVKYPAIKRLLKLLFKTTKFVFGVTFLPYLSLAMRKFYNGPVSNRFSQEREVAVQKVFFQMGD